jgi:hypothetical protein
MSVDHVHAEVEHPLGKLSLTDASTEDVACMSRYVVRPDTHLDRLVRRETLEFAAVEKRYLSFIRTGDPGQMNTIFAIKLNEKVVGYTTLARKSPRINYSHWHIIDDELRGRGVSSALYLHRIKMYFDLYPIDRLIHQTKTWNTGVNRMLDKYVPVSETIYDANPDGLSRPGAFYVRYVERGMLPTLLEPILKPDSMDLPALRPEQMG